MQPNWQIKDLIDLEYFLHQDTERHSHVEENPLRMQDRRIFLDFQNSRSGSFSRGELLKFWVEKRRKSAAAGLGLEASPGNTFAETYGIIRLFLILAALIFGSLLSWSLLSYTGTQPINVFTCLWVMVAPQLALLMILSVSLILKFMGGFSFFAGVHPLLSALIKRLVLWMLSKGRAAVSARRRHSVKEIAGLIGRQKTLYGSIFFWPVFILSQLSGLFFNIGLLGGLLVKVSLTDLAFSWQSTLHLSSKTVYRIVHTISAPWAWMAPPPAGHPTLEQIEGSRLVLKDGMARLTTSDLVSWWPFLFLAILFYGLLPRLLLLAAGAWRLSTALRRIDFTQAACDALIHRMQTPMVETGNRAFSEGLPRPAFSPETRAAGTADVTEIPAEYAILLVPEEIDAILKDDLLAEPVGRNLGLRVLTRMAFGADPDTDAKRLSEILSKTDIPLSRIRILILQEAWQPPIRETVFWIQKLRQAAGKNTGLIIGLIGKLRPGMGFSAPNDMQRIIWTQAANSLGDPFLRVEVLEG